MLQNQNAYTTPMANQSAMMDWSGEITAPEQMRPASDTGRGGIAASPGTMRPIGRVMGPAAGGGTMPAAGDGAAVSSGGPVMMPANGMGPVIQTPPRLAEMRHGLPTDVIDAPTTTQEAYLGSLKAMLSRYVGSYIVATFLVGTQSTVSWDGVLFDVGNDYLTIYQEARDRYIVSDYYSLKFIEFYDVERRRRCAELLEANEWRDSGSAG